MRFAFCYCKENKYFYFANIMPMRPYGTIELRDNYTLIRSCEITLSIYKTSFSKFGKRNKKQ